MEHKVMTMLSVGQVADRLRCRPRDVTSAFYERKLRTDLCPVVSGRRLIPEDYVPMVAMVLRRNGVAVTRDAE
jgi:hypothetical protein